MQIDDFKTWQWVLIGLIAGLAFSLVLTAAGPPFATDELDTIDTSTFEYGLQGRLLRLGQQPLQVRFRRGEPVMRNLIVHPPLGKDEPHQFWVTGQMFKFAVTPKNPAEVRGPGACYGQWVPFKYPAAAPYVGQNGAKESFPTVAGYLAAVQQEKGPPPFSYRVAWQEAPAAIWSLPPAAGFLMIGVAWPLSLGVLRSVGMAKPVRAKDKPEPAPVPFASPVTGVRLAPPPPPPPPPPPEPHGDDKDYRGEFYPVVKPAHHE